MLFTLKDLRIEKAVENSAAFFNLNIFYLIFFCISAKSAYKYLIVHKIFYYDYVPANDIVHAK